MGTLRLPIVAAAILMCGLFAADGRPEAPQADSRVDRGRYIVEDVVECWRCHTPRTSDGVPDRSRWLLGGPVPIAPANGEEGWATVAPRLAGLPPGTDEQIVRLLTTGIARTGAPPRPPMPRFRMTQADAESVLAYLKSLKPTE